MKIDPKFNTEVHEIDVTREGQLWVKDNLDEITEKMKHVIGDRGLVMGLVSAMLAIKEHNGGELMETFITALRAMIADYMPDMPIEAVNTIIASSTERLLKLIADEKTGPPIKKLASHLGFQIVECEHRRLPVNES